MKRAQPLCCDPQQRLWRLVFEAPFLPSINRPCGQHREMDRSAQDPDGSNLTCEPDDEAKTTKFLHFGGRTTENTWCARVFMLMQAPAPGS
jgi:hypothetical protein